MDSLTSLDQLSQLYRTRSPHELAQSLVYGKPKKQGVYLSSKKEKENVIYSKMEPSSMTLLSQKLYNQFSNQLSEIRSSRAFYYKEDQLLLSPARLHSMPSPPQRPMSDLSNRLLEYQTLIIDKKERIKEQVDNERLQQCTFQPLINHKSRTLAVKSTLQEVRSADQFHEDQMKKKQYYLEKKEIALDTIKQQDELAQLASPKISEKSAQLAKQKFPNTNVVERLYQPKQASQQQEQVQQEQANTFRPEISKKSKNIKRDKPVEEYLFEDAKKRKDMSRQTTLQLQQLQTLSQVGPTDNTAGWFVQRFIKDFYFQLNNLERIQESEQKDFSRLAYSETLQILVGLQLLRPISDYEAPNCPQLKSLGQIWKQLTSAPFSPSILSRNLLVFLLAVLNIPLGHIQIPLYKPSALHEDTQMGQSDILFQHRANNLQKDDGDKQQIASQTVQQYKLQFDDAGNLLLDEENVLFLHSQYKELYYNIRLQKGNGTRRQRPAEEDSPFSPKLTKNTHQLSSKKKNGAKLNEWFSLQEEQKKDRLNALKQEVAEQELKQCRFERVTKMTIDLKQLAKAAPKREGKTTLDVEFEKQSEHCTFQPQISSLPAKKVDASNKIDEQIRKTTERLREARVRKEALQVMKSKGFTTNNKTRCQVKKGSEEEQACKKASKLKTVRSQPMFSGLKAQAATQMTEQESAESEHEQEQEPIQEQATERKLDFQDIDNVENADNVENVENVENIDKFDLGGQDDEKMPLLFVDVNIEEGKTARIVVYEGDKSDELAEKFSSEYNLDDSMKLKLKELLDLQINSLLTKIEEENEQESDKEQE